MKVTRVYPVPTEANRRHFVTDDTGALLGVSSFEVDGMKFQTAPLKVDNTSNLLSLVFAQELIESGVVDCTDTIRSAKIIALWARDMDNKLERIEADKFIAPTDGVGVENDSGRRLTCNLIVDTEKYGRLDVHVWIRTHTGDISSVSASHVAGYEIEVELANANRRQLSTADQIRSTPAQRSETPPEVGSASYDDSEFDSGIYFFITKMHEAVPAELKEQITDLFKHAFPVDGTLFKQDAPRQIQLSFYEGVSDVGSAIYNWITQLIMDPETKAPGVAGQDGHAIEVIAVKKEVGEIVDAVRIFSLFPQMTYSESEGFVHFVGIREKSAEIFEQAKILVAN